MSGDSDPRSGLLVVYAVTVAASATTLLRGQLSAMVARGHRVVLVCSPGAGVAEFARDEGVVFAPLPLTRGLLAPGDVISFIRAFRLLRRLRPAAVNVATPKAAFVIGLAAAAARVPVRVYSLWGLRLEGERPGSFRHRLLRLVEWITSRASTVVLCAGAELLARAESLGVLAGRRAVVLGHGSTNGVDLDYFAPPTAIVRAALRAEHDVPPGAVVFGFIGRLTSDKGVAALVDAFRRMSIDRPALLVLIGPEDRTDPLPDTTTRTVADDQRIRRVGVLPDPRGWLHAMDVLVLPTRREGLPNVLLEAGAVGVPSITTTATGCRDAVRAGITSLVVPPDDPPALAAAMERLAVDDGLRTDMGRAGRSHVEQRFGCHAVWRAIADFHADELATVGILSERTSP